MSNISSFYDIFDKSGYFKTNIDPYNDEGDNEVLDYLFDEDGMVRVYGYMEALDFIKDNNCSPFSDVVKYFYSDRFERICAPNYTAKDFFKE